MLIGVSTRKYARSLEPVPVVPGIEEFGTSKSAVSRRFVERTQAQLYDALSRPIEDQHWTALLIDGIASHEHVVVIVMGIDESGAKSVLAFRLSGHFKTGQVLLTEGSAYQQDGALVVILEEGESARSRSPVPREPERQTR